MKAMLYISTVLVLSLSSCAKCYECTANSSGNTSTYCKGDPMYDVIKSGGIPVDYNGNEQECKAKL